MPFPDSDDLEVTVRAGFGADLTAAPSSWAMTDLSSRLVTEQPITISRGVIVGSGPRRTSGCTITLLNDDGALTPELVTSPFWPYVDLGTPIDLSIRTQTVPYLSDSFTRTVASGWGTPDIGPAWGNTAGMSVASGVGRFSHSAANTIRTARHPLAHRDVDLTFTTSLTAVALGDPIRIGPTLRADSSAQNLLWPMLSFDPGGTMRFAIFPLVGGVYQPSTVVSIAGLTYGAGTLIRVRIRWVGDRLQCRAWLAANTEPATWTVDALFTGFAANTHFGIAAWVLGSNTNTLPNIVTVDDLNLSQPKYPRLEGFIADVRPKFRPLGDGTTHGVVEIDIGGVNSRLERRTADPVSPLRRSIEKFRTPPADYWPLEDQRAATSAAHAYPGGPPMVASGPVVFAAEVGVPEDQFLSRFGSTALCSVAAGAKLTASTSLAGAAGPWGVGIQCDVFARQVPGVTEIRIMEWQTPSSFITRWALVCTTTGHAVRAYAADGTVTDVVNFSNNYVALLPLEVWASQSGGNIFVQLVINGNVEGTGSIAGTCTQPTRVIVNPGMANTTLATTVAGLRFTVGHVTVRNTATVTLPYYFDGPQALIGTLAWAREPVHLRLDRLARVEEGIPFRLAADVDTSARTLMNAQQEGGFVELCTDTAEADSGAILYESAFGYEFLPRSARYNQPVKLTVDMATYRRSGSTDPADVLVPKFGNRGPNLWTVERRNGSQAVAAAPKALRDRRGTVSDKATLDLLYDTDLPSHAQWRVHTNVDGTGPNYPGMSIELHANPDLIDGWLACNLGSRVQRTNQPTIAGTQVIDQVIDGITETFTARQSSAGAGWTVTVDTSPADVWDVPVYDDPDARYDSATTTLAEDLTTAETLWDVRTVNAGDVWSTTETPYDVVVDGEVCTVTACTAASFSGGYWNQTFTCTRAVNGIVKTHSLGAEIHIANPGFYAL
ncbi:hypothetical protein [Paractinoplanes maris]|uniref:hypothetical protein n=1 Tax=Paractinoplanes maris TaxID=1734446 RepID=UPI00202138E6|nr:hypothetical protein [Actinoplanes maris]